VRFSNLLHVSVSSFPCSETNLRNLLKSQHDKIEEIKKATNYYSTRDLLEKYDELVSSTLLPILAHHTDLQYPSVTLFPWSNVFPPRISRNTNPCIPSSRNDRRQPRQPARTSRR
jgi:hypothetical protein